MGYRTDQSHRNPELRTDAGVVSAGYRTPLRDPGLGVHLPMQKVDIYAQVAPAARKEAASAMDRLLG
jgi:hypothetical protein